MTLPALKTDGVDAFLNAHGGAAGEFVRFSKEAKFVVVSDNTELSEGTRLNCIFDQTQHGWIKFNGVGKPPTRHMGGMFDGYVPPPRSELGDDDPTLWDPGLDGQPQDPWLFQVLLPLQDEETGKLYIFQTSSKTGLRAVATLISTCKQMAKRESDVWPVVELKVSSFEHRDPRIGLVKKPDFKIVGKVNKSGVPQQIGAGAVLDDEIPF
jgi:hypothetical protein